MIDLQPGDLFEGRWHVERKLGEGGFAVVYAAIDTWTQERVAIKLLKHDMPGEYAPTTASRYRRETRILAQLQCEHTVRLVGNGNTADGFAYLVFEYIDGVELGELLEQRGRLEGHEILHILEQLLEALDEAHRKGLLHRDLKPANILVYERDGDPHAVKLIDFGIARSTDPAATRITQTGALVGTPRYMSPEQLLCKPLTPASDLYSLGLIAFEMALGGGALHGGAFSDQIDRLLSGHVFSVPELERLGARLHEAISKMSAQKAVDRFQSAHAVRVALDLRHPQPRGALEKADQQRQKFNRAVFASLAALVLLVIVAWVATNTGEDRSDPPPLPPPSTHVPVAPDQPEPEPAKVVAKPDYYSAGCLHIEPKEADPDLYLPTVGDEPLPLVVLFHDAGVTHLDFLRGSGFEPIAKENGFAVLAVAGKVRTQPSHDPWHHGIAHAIDRVKRALNEHCIDSRRIYAVGHGHGGGAVHRAACHGWIRGTATVATSAGHEPNICEEIRPLERIRFSLHDHKLAPTFGGLACGAAKVSERTVNDYDEDLAELVGCETDDPSLRDNGKRQERRWTCEVGALERHILPGGRPWPAVFYDPAADKHNCYGEPPRVNYAAEIWAFFARQWALAQTGVENPSAGCGKMAVEPGNTRHLGVDRLAWSVPSTYDRNVAYPLVVLVHDKGVDAGAYLARSGFAAAAERHQFVVVAPQGDEDATWKSGSHLEIARTFEAFVKTACVDLDRVYAVGDYRGAMALEALSCKGFYQALATSSHTPSGQLGHIRDKLQLTSAHLSCDEVPPRPTLILVGAADEVPIEARTAWATHADGAARIMGCRDETEPVTLGPSECDAFSGCDQQLSYCLLPLSSWPESPLGRHHPGPEATDAIWAFFESVGERAEHEVDGE